MLYVDKYRPKSLDSLDLNPNLTSRLTQLVLILPLHYSNTQANGTDLPHLCFYGPSGAGKKTRIMALLREIFGSTVEKLKIQQKNFQTPSGTKLQLHTIASTVHVEMTPRYSITPTCTYSE